MIYADGLERRGVANAPANETENRQRDPLQDAIATWRSQVRNERTLLKNRLEKRKRRGWTRRGYEGKKGRKWRIKRWKEFIREKFSGPGLFSVGSTFTHWFVS